jgi:hypothetical protein
MTVQEQVTLAGIICSFLVGIGGIIFAGFNQYLNYKSRTAQFRHKVYDEQIKLYPELIMLLRDAVMGAIAFHHNLTNRDSDSRRQAIASWSEANDCCIKHAAILPEDVIKSADKVTSSVFSIVLPASDDKQSGQLTTLVASLDKLHQNVIQAMRRCSGVDILTKETLSLIGVSNQAEQMRQRNRAQQNTEPDWG